MPIETKYYRCRFKCGKKAMASDSSMRSHENNCWRNPENQTCMTCKNGNRIEDGDYFRKWSYWECINPEGEQRLSETRDDRTKEGNEYPLAHCPFWEAQKN